MPASLRTAFAIAWPASLAAIITPLLGLIDAGVIARGGSTEVLAATSLAATVFSFLYWTFGFIRMSLAGLSAQALGARNEGQLVAHLLQGMLLGGAAGLVMLACFWPITLVSQSVLAAPGTTSPETLSDMAAYIRVRIVTAPFALMSVAIFGWLSGQGRTRSMMLITLVIALLNTGLSILFVLRLGLGIEGLAAATAIAETAGFLLGLGFTHSVWKARGRVAWSTVKPLIFANLGRVLSLNRDIFLRTAILTLVYMSFTKFGAALGDDVVAANHVLMSMVLASTMLFDGTAIAAEALVGQALGATRDRVDLFRAAWRRTAQLTAVLAAVLTLFFALFAPAVLTLVVGAEGRDLIEIAEPFLVYLVIAPLLLAPAFHLDGVFIGATRAKALRNAMAISGMGFFGAAFLLMPQLGNHGLWLAFLFYMLLRAAALILSWRGFGALLEDKARAARH